MSFLELISVNFGLLQPIGDLLDTQKSILEQPTSLATSRESSGAYLGHTVAFDQFRQKCELFIEFCNFTFKKICDK